MAVEMIEAVVQAGSVETSYLRAGQGTPMFLLTPRPPAALMEDPLLLALVARFRVIVPALPSVEVDPGAWLRDIMDGLGCGEQTRVVVELPAPEEESLTLLLRKLEVAARALT
ncbi:MAG TPA: hypothetical protein VFO52_14310 [Longimicrobiales bacterium]|nr:hypothetical protein [Longimicrobiales bacterium]